AAWKGEARSESRFDAHPHPATADCDAGRTLAKWNRGRGVRAGVDARKRAVTPVCDPRRARARGDVTRIAPDAKRNGRGHAALLRVDPAHGLGVSVQDPDGPLADRDGDGKRGGAAEPIHDPDTRPHR